MRNRFIGSILEGVAVFAFSPVILAQESGTAKAQTAPPPRTCRAFGSYDPGRVMALS